MWPFLSNEQSSLRKHEEFSVANHVQKEAFLRERLIAERKNTLQITTLYEKEKEVIIQKAKSESNKFIKRLRKLEGEIVRLKGENDELRSSYNSIPHPQALGSKDEEANSLKVTIAGLVAENNHLVSNVQKKDDTILRLELLVEESKKEQSIVQKQLADKTDYITTIEQNYAKLMSSKEADSEQILKEQNMKMQRALDEINHSSHVRTSELESQVEGCISQINNLRKENVEIQRRYDELKKVTDEDILAYDEKLRRQTHELNVLRSEKSDIEAAHHELSERYSEKEKEIEELLNTLEEVRQTIVTSETQWKQRFDKFKSLTKDKIGKVNHDLELAHNEVNKSNDIIAKMKIEIEEITGQRNQSGTEISQLQEKSRETAALFKAERDAMTAENATLQAELLKSKELNSKFEEDVKNVECRNSTLVTEMEQLQAELELLRNKNFEMEKMFEEYKSHQNSLLDSHSQEILASKNESSQLLQKILVDKQVLVEENCSLRQQLNSVENKHHEVMQELRIENQKHIDKVVELEKLLVDAQQTISEQTTHLQELKDRENKWIEEKEKLMTRLADLKKIGELLTVKEEEVQKISEDYQSLVDCISTNDEKWKSKIQDAEEKQTFLEAKLLESSTENKKSLAELNARLERERVNVEELKREKVQILQQQNSEIELLQSKITSLMSEVEILRTSIQEKDSSIVSLEDRIQASKTQTQNKHNRWRQQIKELREKNSELEIALKNAEENTARMLEALNEKDAALDAASNQYAEILSAKEQDKLAELKQLTESMQEMMKSALAHEENEWKKKLKDLSLSWQEKELSLNSKLIQLKENLETKEHELALSDEKLQSTRKNLENLKIDHELMEKKFTETEKRLQEAIEEVNSKESKISIFVSEIDSSKKQIIELETALAKLFDKLSTLEAEKLSLQQSFDEQRVYFESYSRETNPRRFENEEDDLITIQKETAIHESVESLQQELRSKDEEIRNIQALVQKFEGEKDVLESEMLQCQSEREVFWQELLEEKENECKLLLEKAELLQSMINSPTIVHPPPVQRHLAGKELSEVLAQKVLESRDALYSQITERDLLISSIQTEVIDLRKELTAAKEEKDALKQRMRSWKQKVKAQYEQEKQEWSQRDGGNQEYVEQSIQTDDEDVAILSKASLLQIEQQGKLYETLQIECHRKEQIVSNLLNEKEQLLTQVTKTEEQVRELEERIKSMKAKFKSHSSKLHERISAVENEKAFLESVSNRLENKFMHQEEIFSRSIATKKAITFLDPLYVTPPSSPNRHGTDISGNTTLASSVTTTGTMSINSECFDVSTIATTSSPAKDPNPTPHRPTLSTDNTPTVRSLQQEILFLKKKYKDRTQYSMAKIRTLQHELDIKSQEFCTLQHEYNQLEFAYSQLVEDFQSLSTNQTPESAELKEGEGDGNEMDMNDAGVALESIQQEMLNAASTEDSKEDLQEMQEKKIASMKLMCEKFVEKYEIQKQKLLNKLSKKREVIQLLKDSVKEQEEKVSKLSNSLKSLLAEKRTQNAKLTATSTTSTTSTMTAEGLGIAELDEDYLLLEENEEEERMLSCGTEKDDHISTFSFASTTMKEAKALVAAEESSSHLRHTDLIDELYNIHRVLTNSLNEIEASKSSALASFPTPSSLFSTVIAPFSGIAEYDNTTKLVPGSSENSKKIDKHSLTALVDSLIRRIKELEEDKGMKLQVNIHEHTPSADVQASESADCSSPISLMSLASVHGTVMSMAKSVKQQGTLSTPSFEATMMPSYMTVIEETITNIRNQLHYYLTAQSIQETEHYSTSLILLLHCTDEERENIFAMMMKLAPMIVAYSSFESISEDFSATIESIVYGKDTGSDTGSELSVGTAWRRRGKSIPEILEAHSLQTPHKAHTMNSLQYFGLPLDHDSHLSPPPSIHTNK